MREIKIRINTLKKKLLVISMLVVIGSSFGFTICYTAKYFILKPEYELILENYEKYRNFIDDGFYDYVKNLPLPIKMQFFFDYVRFQYLELTNNLDFMVALVLHDTGFYNFFSDCSEELSKIWITNNSMEESDLAMSKVAWWDYCWRNPNVTRKKLHTYVHERIYYNNDTNFTEFTNQSGDYCKAPVETAYTFQGDCEDISVLLAALLLASGYEVILGDIHDLNFNDMWMKEFHHAFLWVKYYPTNPSDFCLSKLWRFGNLSYEWLLLDPTEYYYGDDIEWVTHYDNLNIDDWSKYMRWRVVAPPGYPSLALNDLKPSHE